MKKIIITIAVLAAMSLMTVSCKNNANAAEKNHTECCGNHEGGECTKAEGEKCAKCLEAAGEAHQCNHKGGECKGEGQCNHKGGECKSEGQCNHEGGEHQCNGNHENCEKCNK